MEGLTELINAFTWPCIHITHTRPPWPPTTPLPCPPCLTWRRRKSKGAGWWLRVVCVDVCATRDNKWALRILQRMHSQWRLNAVALDKTQPQPLTHTFPSSCTQNSQHPPVQNLARPMRSACPSTPPVLADRPPSTQKHTQQGPRRPLPSCQPRQQHPAPHTRQATQRRRLRPLCVPLWGAAG